MFDKNRLESLRLAIALGDLSRYYYNETPIELIQLLLIEHDEKITKLEEYVVKLEIEIDNLEDKLSIQLLKDSDD